VGLTNLKDVLHSYGDSNVFGESYGEGPVRVVWLHGWARRAEDFVLVASQLAELGVSSVALDLPGFGSSPLPLVPGGARHYAELIVPALEILSEEPVVLVGHSLGGRVATVISATHPELVKALVLSAAPLLRSGAPRRSPRVFRIARWLHSHRLLSEQQMESYRQKYGSTDYRRAQGMIRQVLVAMVSESYENELADIVAPVSFLWGELDNEVPTDIAERAAAMLTVNHAVRVLPGIGHMVPLEAPDELARVVIEVLST
jgi:pimeloyl-ACP methyl ester carboxylesterase